MRKLPAFQFYPGDWLKDPAVAMCSPATRGIWIDILCAAHESAQHGSLTGTPDQFARICRCLPSEFVAAANELLATHAADVRERGGIFTITNRRMKREADLREGERLKKQRQRKAPENGNVPFSPGNVPTLERVGIEQDNGQLLHLSRDCPENVPSYSSSSSSSSEEKEENKQKHTLSASPTVLAVFDHWRTAMGHPEAKLTAKRQRVIANRLREGYTVEQLQAAIDGCRASPFHRGENDRQTVYDDLELICRDGGKVEKFLALATQASTQAPPQPPAKRKSLCPKGKCSGSGFIHRPGQDQAVLCECQE